MHTEHIERPRPLPESAGRHAEERLRILELEQTRLLARHEAVVAQLSSLRSTLRGMERLLEIRLQRLEHMRRMGAEEGLP